MFILVYMSYWLNLHSLLEDNPNSLGLIVGEDEEVFIDALTVFGSVSLSLSVFLFFPLRISLLLINRDQTPSSCTLSMSPNSVS